LIGKARQFFAGCGLNESNGEHGGYKNQLNLQHLRAFVENQFQPAQKLIERVAPLKEKRLQHLIREGKPNNEMKTVMTGAWAQALPIRVWPRNWPRT
jgi:hypothetical protein